MSGRTTIPATQNLLTRTDVGHADWAVISTNITRTQNAAIGPDGTMTATTLSPIGGVSMHYAALGFIVPAPYQFNPRRMSYSCFIKRGGATQWALIGDDRHTAFVFAWFDIQNGVIGSVTADNDTGIAVTNTIEALPNAEFPDAAAGWFKCSMSYLMVSPGGGAGANASSLCVGPTTADGTSSFNSAAGVSCDVWGPQMVGGANQTGLFVATTGAAVNTGSIRSRP